MINELEESTKEVSGAWWYQKAVLTIPSQKKLKMHNRDVLYQFGKMEIAFKDS